MFEHRQQGSGGSFEAVCPIFYTDYSCQDEREVFTAKDPLGPNLRVLSEVPTHAHPYVPSLLRFLPASLASYLLGTLPV